GTVLALRDVLGVVRLVAPNTGKELARLTAPEQTFLEPCCFTADGSSLVTWGAETGALHQFDLRAIRRQLKELHLDWEAPELPPPEPPRSTEPLQIDVVGVDVLEDPGKWARYEREGTLLDLAVNPFDASARARLGTLLLDDKHPAEAAAQLDLALALRP